ncbi:hypothetical protein GQ55_8G043800 [Panicum hallii var. hallii]|uniref:Uncharacterized protein n=1 Tax=Panicum hallii var. hallii TaxID=1504633 RepID=A0A2T7CKM3_9POAL|nr:hypothetical protein GQ55_8G043800 [Panicum hallii var. hallii]
MVASDRLYHLPPCSQEEADEVGFVHAHDEAVEGDAREALVGVERPELRGVYRAVLHPLHGAHPQSPGADDVGVVRALAPGGALAAAAAAAEDVDELQRAAAAAGGDDADVPVRFPLEAGIPGERQVLQPAGALRFVNPISWRS